MHLFLVFMLLLATPALAAPPRVVTDIAPVQSLAASVMGDLGTPALLLDPTADPHHVQLRPSQARQLAEADLVIWMGPELTPWMGRVIATLGDAAELQLLSLDPLASRIAGDAGLDPHAWLDPANAVLFLQAIARALSLADPENSATYTANAEATARRLGTLETEIRELLRPLRAAVLIPYHDAYRYFLSRYGLRVTASLADHDAAPPSAARLREVNAILADADRGCLFAEPGRGAGLIAGLASGPGIGTAILDPIGAALTPGPALYESLIRNMARTIADCAQP